MVWVVFAVRLPVARVSGRDRLRQAPRLFVAVAVVDAVGARPAAQAERDRLAAFFRAGRVLHLLVLHRPEARSAGGFRMVRLRAVGPVRLRP